MLSTITIDPASGTQEVFAWVPFALICFGLTLLIGGAAATITLLVVRKLYDLRQVTSPILKTFGGILASLSLLSIVAGFGVNFLQDYSNEPDRYARVVQRQTVALERADFHNVRVELFIGNDDQPHYTFSGSFEGNNVRGSLMRVDTYTYAVYYQTDTTT